MRDVSVAPRHRRRVRHAACAHDDDAIRVVGAGADGRRFHRDRAGRGAAAAGDAALLDQHPAAVAADLRHHRDAGLFHAALSPGAADAPHHRQHDGVPRRPGKSGARDRRVGPPRRDRPGRARACLDAGRPRLDAAAEEPARLARACGVEDQPRPAQPAHLGAAVLRGARAPARPARAALRAQADARAGARHRVLRIDAVLRPRPGAAAGPQAGRARADRRGGARHAAARGHRGSAGSPRSSAA